MLKYVLITSAFAFASPSLAQQATSSGQAVSESAPAQATTAPAQSSDRAAQPQAATAGQVAQIVDQEFPTYDANADGSLDEPEFAAWMAKLRAASNPAATADAAEEQSWANEAFASADTDQNKLVSKAELTTFLSKGAS